MLSWIKNNRLISGILIVKLILAFGVVTFFPLEVDAGRVYVRGYYRKDGTYVRPHYRSAPDGNPYNNYSFPGNYNPNTGKITPGNPQTYLDRYYNRSSYSSTRSSNSTRSYSSTRRNYSPITRKTSFGNFFKRFRSGERKSTSSTRRSLKSSFFTVGSTKSEVIAVQGTPDSSTENQLSYGSSTVYLEDGRVKRWHNSFLRPLQAKTRFTVGSTKSEVIAVQGTPDSSTEVHLSYGLSIVYFRDGRVTSWKSYYPDVLKVK